MATATDAFPVRLTRSRAIPWEKAGWLPLAFILVAQIILSARLIPSALASPDEARYIVSGHQLIYELWHGGGSPYYETYFSGAPVIYPILAALADHLGGLVAVRLMSLTFMLVVTCLLFGTSRRLFGYWTGIAAAVLFAGLGLTHDLGAYANYDGLALGLLAAATYCASRTGDGERHATRWLLFVPACLLLANASKYMTVLFDPVVIGIAALQLPGKRAIQRALALGAGTVMLLALSAALAGGAYVRGIMFTTLARPTGTQHVLSAFATPTHVILYESARWIGVVIVLAVAGVLLTRKDRACRVLLAVMLAAGLLVTLEALHLRSDESMRQHDDFGAWFACIAAGYALSKIPQYLNSRSARYAVATAMSLLVLAAGVQYTMIDSSTYEGGVVRRASTLPFYALVRPYLTLSGARYLIDGQTDFHLIYSDHVNIPWYNLFDNYYIKYPIPGRGGDSHGQTRGPVCMTLKTKCIYLQGIAGYRTAIHAHWFALISLYNELFITKTDKAIEQAVTHTPGYTLLTRAGGKPTWIYAPSYKRFLASTGRGLALTTTPKAHGPAATTVLRGLAVAMEPSGIFLAGGLLVVGASAWPRRRRLGAQHGRAESHTAVKEDERS